MTFCLTTNCKCHETPKFEELKYLILEWADARNLIQKLPEQALVQMGKMEEEVAELRDALQTFQINNVNNASAEEINESFRQAELELGDVLVTIIVTAACAGIDPVDCLSKAYQKIKYRQGKTVNGIFVKET